MNLNPLKKIIPKTLKIQFRKFFPNKIPVRVNAFGFNLYQNDDDIINYSKYNNSKLEDYNNLSNDCDDFVFAAISKYCKQGSYALDIGANIGLMALAMSRIVGEEGKVFAFEPGPISYALLTRNIYKNVAKKNGNIIAEHIALTSRSTKVPLFINPNGESDNQIHLDKNEYNFKDEESRCKVIVRGMRLDDYFESEGLNYEKISFIKIDTQGHELEILKGANKVISNSNDLKILCEFCPYLKQWENHSIEEFFDLIKSYKLKIYDTRYSINKEIGLSYLVDNYGFDKVSKYTDLLLVK